MRRSGEDERVPPVFTPISQERFVANVRTIAAAIGADHGWQPDLLIGIGRGGLVPAVYLSHAIGVPMRSCDWSGATPGADVLVQLAARTRNGERLLFVDDINDSGLTIAAIRTALAAAEAVPGAIRFAVLIDNIVSSQRVDYRACAIDRTVTKDWFVFPWEALAPDSALTEDAAAVPQRIG